MNLSQGVTASRSFRVAWSSPVIADSRIDSGVSSASRSVTSDDAMSSASAMAAVAFSSTCVMR
jgi:hypothetical protein